MDYMSVTKNTHGHFTDDEILAIRRHYFAMVAETDAMLGQVLDTLKPPASSTTPTSSSPATTAK